MKKGIIIALVIAGLLALGSIVLLAPKAPTAALLYIDQGTVEVNTGDGWTRAGDEMELSKNDQVRTFDGQATIVLFEGEVITLAPDSHLVLDALRSREIKITQLAGETWNKVTKISGITDYTVTTPTTVATVRGTEFYLTPFEVQVSEGAVSYWNKKEPQNTVTVRRGHRALASELVETELTPEQRAQLKKYRQNYITVMKRVRWREVKKHQTLLNMAAKRGATEDDIKRWLTEVDQGKRSEDELYHKVPFVLRSKATRTYEITKVIKQAIRDTQ